MKDKALERIRKYVFFHSVMWNKTQIIFRHLKFSQILTGNVLFHMLFPSKNKQAENHK